MPVLELTTTGRQTGRSRTVMLTSPVQEGTTLVVVASRGGDDKAPAWFLNLQDNPEVGVALQGKPTQPMHARVADTAERARTVAPGGRRPPELRRLPDQDHPRDRTRPARTQPPQLTNWRGGWGHTTSRWRVVQMARAAQAAR